MKYFLKTFGCQMNFADSDEMTRAMTKAGFSSTDAEADADAIVVNTCTVRDLAEHKASSFIGRLRDWKAERPGRLVIVTGCAAERAKKEFKHKFPYIDLILGAVDIETFPKEFDRLLARMGIDEEDLVQGTALAPAMKNMDIEADHGRPSSAIQYVTIMRGCNFNCTYCIVPAVRGRERYRAPGDILTDVEARVREGGKEIWLLGQTVNSYESPTETDKPYEFSNLLNDVATVAGVRRLRFMSPHPFYLTDALIDTIASNKIVCEHLHLPVQSGSNKILQAMKRNYTRETYLRGLQKLRDRIPSIAITTDLIVGFPGETDADFEETLDLVEKANFDSAYCFKYSPRPGTPSAAMEDDVLLSVKEKRVQKLLSLTETQGVNNVSALVDTEQEVLVEEDKGDGIFRGKTRTAWKVRFPAKMARLGDVVRVKIIGQHSRELHGEIIQIL